MELFSKESDDIREILKQYLECLNNHLFGAIRAYERKKKKHNILKKLWNILIDNEDGNYEWELIK